MRSAQRRILALAAIVLLHACGSGESATSDVTLTLDTGGVDVGSVEYNIECGSDFDVQGLLEVVADRDPPIWSTVIGLPVGDCTVTLTAKDAEGNELCSDTKSVTVVENESTKVEMTLECPSTGGATGDIEIDGQFQEEDCPSIHILNAIPTMIPPGQDTAEIEFKVSGATSTTLESSSGTIVSNDNGSFFTCSQSGPVTITGTATNDTCTMPPSTFIVAVCPSGGGTGGTGGGGGTGGTGGTPAFEMFRWMVYRVYLGRLNPIPRAELPEVRVVLEDGRERRLPVCPLEPKDVPAALFTELLAQGASVETAFELTSERFRGKLIGGVQMSLHFPYCSWSDYVNDENFNIVFPDNSAYYAGMPLSIPGPPGEDPIAAYRVSDDEFFESRFIQYALYSATGAPYTTNHVPSWLTDYQINSLGRQRFGRRVVCNPWRAGSPSNECERTPGYEIDVLPMPPSEAGVNWLPYEMPSTGLAFPDNVLDQGNSTLLPCLTRDSAFPCALTGMFLRPTAKAQSSVFGNADNAYLAALIPVVNVEIRPRTADLLYVIRGERPLTALGSAPVPWANSDGVVSNEFDMRYWAMCNARYWGRLATIEPDGCVRDDDLETAGIDVGETYTLVVSTADNKPEMFKRSRIANGMIWIQAEADALTSDRRRNLLQMRNMLINTKNFTQTIQNIPQDADWRSAFDVLGDFYPAITIQCTTEIFNAKAEAGPPEDAWKACFAGFQPAEAQP